jgi:hypothetical protein
MPLFLPSQPVAGVAANIGGPIQDLLKLIAGKDLGTLPIGWIIWLREKLGEIGAPERDAYRDQRSVRERMNAP